MRRRPYLNVLGPVAWLTAMVRVALSMALLCSALVVSASSASAATTTGFVTRSGTQLKVGGTPWRFAGYNLPCANPFDLTASQLGVYLDDIQQNSGANVIRVWFFQSDGGPGNWTPFDTVISALKARGMRAIVTLTNETSTCDEPSASTFYKTPAWYQTGYQSPEGGYPLSFHDYGVAVAQHYASEPTVAFWQLVNEAQAPSYDTSGNLTCSESAAAAALRTFSDAMTGAIKAVDPNHLVDLGTQGPGVCGLQTASDYSYVHAGALDLCEYHDYGAPATPTPAGLATVTSVCGSLGKPTYIGESGIPANVGPDGNPNSACDPWPSCSPYPITITTLDQRASFFQAKLQAATNAGLAGYVIWVKSPFYSDSTDGYDIADGDPVEPALKQYGLANPPVSMPEARWTWALPGLGLLVCGGFAAIARRRRIRIGA